MSTGLKRSGFAVLAAVSFFLSGAVQAGQPVAAETAEGEAAPLDPEAMNLEQLRVYQAFYYLGGGRDPMTMRLPTDRERNREVKLVANKVVPTLDQMDDFLSKALLDTEAAFKARDYDGALTISAAAMKTVDEDWPPLKSDPPELKIMDGQIRAYNRLAANVKRQEETRKEFNTLQILIDGIFWSPGGARAVINGRPAEAGESLIEVRREGDLRVEAVEEHGVVFQFKGMRFRKTVDVFSGAGAGVGGGETGAGAGGQLN